MCNQIIKTSDKTVCLEDIDYSINEVKKTVSVIKHKLFKIDIILPVSINYKSEKSIVTNIASKEFKFFAIRSISFEGDSDQLTIQKDEFEWPVL